MMADASDTPKFSQLPVHIAIVPDGNGRWAEQRGLPRLSGHKAGIENMRRLVKILNEYPIKYVTLYGFSTENWNRPEAEVTGLFRLVADFMDKTALEIHKQGVKLRHLGRIDKLPRSLQQSIDKSIELTKNNSGMTLSIAFNYGARAEILDAVRRLIADGVAPEDIDEKMFESYLYTAGLPDVDLLIRTGDELRSSNFLLWQSTYSEYHFTKVLWPDFGKKDIDKALLAFSQRQRRFGGL